MCGSRGWQFGSVISFWMAGRSIVLICSWLAMAGQVGDFEDEFFALGFEGLDGLADLAEAAGVAGGEEGFAGVLGVGIETEELIDLFFGGSVFFDVGLDGRGG